jgi:uncharacterized protein YodC (DUF2158 family)
MEDTMTIEAGTVVTLKSGGQTMTVVAVDGDTAECLWCGEEGDFFREKIPTIALQLADDEDEVENETDEDESDEDETDEDQGDDEEAGEDEAGDEDDEASTKRTAA